MTDSIRAMMWHMPETSKNVVQLIVEQLAHQNNKGLKKYGESIDSVQDDAYDYQSMAMEELIDGIQYMVKENQKIKKENNCLRKDNSLLYDENDRLHEMNRGLIKGTRQLVKDITDLREGGR